MAHPDLNLLVTLDVLLAEGSVARAARRLRLSPSAMSRALARLRAATGDPLLVRAGRGLVPTPRALELRGRTGPLVEAAEALLRPAERLDLARLERGFVLQSAEGFAETFGPALLARVAREAPGLRLRFEPRLGRQGAALRDGSADLQTGVVGPELGPELRSQALFRDRFVAVVPPGHPLARGRLTPARYAAAPQVRVARIGQERGTVDEALAALGLERRVAVTVGGYGTALAFVRAAGLVATVPERHTAGLRGDLVCLELPFALDEVTIALLWHPRHEADQAHRWLRERLREVCGEGA